MAAHPAVRRVAPILAAALCLAAAPVDWPTRPAALTPFLDGDVLPIGEYGWMRGRFPGATQAESEAFVAVLHFDNACIARSREVMRAEFVRLGVTFDPKEDVFARPAACREVQQVGAAASVTWPEFTAARDRVRPYVLGFVRATDFAANEVEKHGTLGEQLRMHTVAEQALRYAMIDRMAKKGVAAGYTPLEATLYDHMVSRALGERDAGNTAWLAQLVAAQGWPRISQVGEESANAAWLLVQHADADPAFQLRALRLMEALLPAHEVSASNYGYLYDRVMLRVSGRQRYGTQWHCAAGGFVPRPLEADAASADRSRKQAGMETLDQNRARMVEVYGKCAAG